MCVGAMPAMFENKKRNILIFRGLRVGYATITTKTILEEAKVRLDSLPSRLIVAVDVGGAGSLACQLRAVRHRGRAG